MPNRKVLVVAPHPDDETFGCGGTLLKHLSQRDELSWLIMTHVEGNASYSQEFQAKRRVQIADVARHYQFAKVKQLPFFAAELDVKPKCELIQAAYDAVREIAPEIVYLPYRNDVHSDHEVTFDVLAATTKKFRMPSIRRVLCYETLSETEFSLKPHAGFQPNVFVDISQHLVPKLEILKIYASELGDFPFPRSNEAVSALAVFRGAASGCKAAEAFLLIREFC